MAAGMVVATGRRSAVQMVAWMVALTVAWKDAWTVGAKVERTAAD